MKKYTPEEVAGSVVTLTAYDDIEDQFDFTLVIRGGKPQYGKVPLRKILDLSNIKDKNPAAHIGEQFGMGFH